MNPLPTPLITPFPSLRQILKCLKVWFFALFPRQSIYFKITSLGHFPPNFVLTFHNCVYKVN